MAFLSRIEINIKEKNMKKASKVLGIIGGVLGVIIGIILSVYGALFVIIGNVASSPGDDVNALENLFSVLGGAMFYGYGITCLILGLIGIAGAVLGFVGASKVKKRHILAGVLLLVAAVLSISTAIGIIATVLFILAGIFALLREKKAEISAA